MPLFEVQGQGLVPFRRVPGGPELYEQEIERLLWANLEDFTGIPLFPVARQPNILGGGRPDIVALDEGGHVVVMEVKRDVDRGQLAQCLEYAGWARTTNLDELAGMFHGGQQVFFAAWQEFTQTDSPILLQRPPKLILVARDFHGRTESALSFLVENQLPVDVLRVTVYEDQQGRRFIDVSSEHEPEVGFPVEPVPGQTTQPRHPTLNGRRISVSDLIEAGLLKVGDTLVWVRPRMGQEYRAEVTDKGGIRLEDGRVFSTPSRAAMDAAGMVAYDGWLAWRVPRLGNVSLGDLREQLVKASEAASAAEAVIAEEAGRAAFASLTPLSVNT